MSNWVDCEAVPRGPGKVSGAWVFAGTRVPVSALFEKLKDGATIDDFLPWCPGISRQKVDDAINAIDAIDAVGPGSYAELNIQ